MKDARGPYSRKPKKNVPYLDHVVQEHIDQAVASACAEVADTSSMAILTAVNDEDFVKFSDLLWKHLALIVKSATRTKGPKRKEDALRDATQPLRETTYRHPGYKMV